MKYLSPKPGDLSAIETASRDEIEALQIERMRWSLTHAYTNVPHYKQSFDAAGVHPDDLKSLADLARFPFTVKTDLRNNYPLWPLRCATQPDQSHSRLLWHHGPTHSGRLYQSRFGDVG